MEKAIKKPVTCSVCNSPSTKKLAKRYDGKNILKCLGCGHIYIGYRFTESELAHIYSNYHVTDDDQTYIKTVSSWFEDPRGPYQHAISVVKNGAGFSGKKILDVGCGLGKFLHECNKFGADVWGVDRSKRAATLAKKYFNLNIINKTLEQTIFDGDLKETSFDMIFSFETIEHVLKPAEFLLTLRKLLKPEGLIYISTPNFYLFNVLGKATPLLEKWDEHIHFFEPKSLESCVRKAGLCVVSTTTLEPFAFGDRKKQKLAKIPIVMNTWKKLRTINFIYKAKDMIFKSLNKHKEKVDYKSWNGDTLICVASKK